MRLIDGGFGTIMREPRVFSPVRGPRAGLRSMGVAAASNSSPCRTLVEVVAPFRSTRHRRVLHVQGQVLRAKQATPASSCSARFLRLRQQLSRSAEDARFLKLISTLARSDSTAGRCSTRHFRNRNQQLSRQTLRQSCDLLRDVSPTQTEEAFSRHAIKHWRNLTSFPLRTMLESLESGSSAGVVDMMACRNSR